MPFLAASGGFTRYRLTDPVPDALWAEIPDRLKKNAFQDIDRTADERSFGWVSFDDWLDPGFTAAPPEKGQFLAFTLRLDTRRVSPAVFKKHLQLAVNEYLSGIDDPAKRFVSKGRKAELKEQVALRLRARSLPIPAVFDVVWNTANGTLLLASTNAKVKSLFEDHFLATFELNLEPQKPFFLASRMSARGRFEPEETGAHQFPPPGCRPGQEQVCPTHPAAAESALHQEFLTWLWYKTRPGRAVQDPGRLNLQMFMAKMSPSRRGGRFPQTASFHSGRAFELYEPAGPTRGKRSRRAIGWPSTRTARAGRAAACEDLHLSGLKTSQGRDRREEGGDRSDGAFLREALPGEQVLTFSRGLSRVPRPLRLETRGLEGGSRGLARLLAKSAGPSRLPPPPHTSFAVNPAGGRHAPGRKKALVFGVVNERSIAYGIAKALSDQGARLALGYAAEPIRKRIEPIAAKLGADFVLQ